MERGASRGLISQDWSVRGLRICCDLLRVWSRAAEGREGCEVGSVRLSGSAGTMLPREQGGAPPRPSIAISGCVGTIPQPCCQGNRRNKKARGGLGCCTSAGRKPAHLAT